MARSQSKDIPKRKSRRSSPKSRKEHPEPSVDIHAYLELHRDIYPASGRREDPSFLSSLREDAATYLKGAQPQLIEIYSSIATHEVVSINDSDYLIWDLHLTHVWEVLNLCIFGAASSYVEPFVNSQGEILKAVRGFCRQLFCTYFASKLKRKAPYTSAAFATIAIELGGDWQIPLKGSKATLMRNIVLMQRMLMFHHEICHIYYRRTPEKLDAFKRSFEGVLRAAGQMLGDYDPQDLILYPQFRKDVATGLFERPLLNFFLEEVACDTQSFVLGARTIAESREKRLWVDGLSELHLASTFLALGELMLKVGSSFWTEFAIQTGDGTTLDMLRAEQARLVTPNLDSERPVFNMRQSYKQVALSQALAPERCDGVDLTEHFNVIATSHKEIRDIWETVVLTEFHSLFSEENLAAIFARAKNFKTDCGVSAKAAGDVTNRTLRRFLGLD
jgi:hypothetical protein